MATAAMAATMVTATEGDIHGHSISNCGSKSDGGSNLVMAKVMHDGSNDDSNRR